MQSWQSGISPVPSKQEVPIALELFDRVEEYADSLQEVFDQEDDEEDLQLESSTSIIVFCENFFAQFFRSTLGTRITSLDQAAKIRAVKARLGLPKNGRYRSKRRLIVQFEKLCDMWPDIQGHGYSGSNAARTEFNLVYIPKLLERITTWATDADQLEVAERAREATEYYVDTVEGC